MSSNERFLYTSVDDPLARPLFDGLEQEYDSRYADGRHRTPARRREHGKERRLAGPWRIR